MNGPIQALIFDFDGLLVDTETPAYNSWVEIFRQHGAELPRSLYQLDIGTTGAFDAAMELSRLTGRSVDADSLAAARQAIKEQLSVGQPLLPGVLELLQAGRAAGLPMAVASSSSSTWVERWLTEHAIRDYFQCICTRDDVVQVKPAPDLFLAAARCLAVAPAACLVFEDSPNGMRAAAAAGMRCIAVPSDLTFDLPQPPVARTLTSLAGLDLATLLRELGAAE